MDHRGKKSGRTTDPAREIAAWYARLTADDATVADREAFEEWLADPRNAAMVGRLHDALEHADVLGKEAFAVAETTFAPSPTLSGQSAREEDRKDRKRSSQHDDV